MLEKESQNPSQKDTVVNENRQAEMPTREAPIMMRLWLLTRFFWRYLLKRTPAIIANDLQLKRKEYDVYMMPV